MSEDLVELEEKGAKTAQKVETEKKEEKNRWCIPEKGFQFEANVKSQIYKQRVNTYNHRCISYAQKRATDRDESREVTGRLSKMHTAEVDQGTVWSIIV